MADKFSMDSEYLGLIEADKLFVIIILIKFRFNNIYLLLGFVVS